MSDIFHKHVSVRFQPRTVFQEGRQWSEELKSKYCLFDGKYCVKMGEDWEKASKDVDPAAAKFLQPREQIIELIREQCVFDALQGQKSHWFRFMKVLIDGCVV
jgi:hypothetical protein